MTKFTVTMKEQGAWEEDYIHEFESEKAARTHADNLSKENPEKLVHISFLRKSDGQQGYINREGADVTGKAW